MTERRGAGGAGSVAVAPLHERTFARDAAAAGGGAGRGYAPVPEPPLQLAALDGELVAWRTLAGDPDLPWLLGIHGLGSSSTDLVPVAATSGLRAVLLDLPGFGGSDRPDRDYPVARAAACALALLDRLGIARAVWLGCSYGGHVALRAALDRPAAVAALVLAASGGLAAEVDPAVAARFDERHLAARGEGEVRAACAALARRRTPLVERFVARRALEHVEGAERASHRAIARSAAGALADATARRLHEVAAPVYLVHGEGDPLVPVALAHGAAERFACASVTVLADLGHLPWLEDPAALAAVVRAAATPRRSGRERDGS